MASNENMTPLQKWPLRRELEKPISSSITARDSFQAWHDNHDTEKDLSEQSWTPLHQKRTQYESNVKLFYSTGTHATWSLGTKYILKEHSSPYSPRREAGNLSFVRDFTTIPVPVVKDQWTDENGKSFSLMTRIEGETMDKLWIVLSSEDKQRIAEQVAIYLAQLRILAVDHADDVGAGDTQWEKFSKQLVNVSDEVREKLRSNMPVHSPYVFTHGDLAIHNIIVKDKNFAGLIGWEYADYLPVWYEAVHCRMGNGEQDAEWKQLLSEYMPRFPQALRFCVAHYFCSTAPESPEALAALGELEDDTGDYRMFVC
ncbi:kinase-like protein [Hypoxylon sp. FL1857]|nr:kinase-like protein [Hypoxylon sp. FL1857]